MVTSAVDTRKAMGKRMAWLLPVQKTFPLPWPAFVLPRPPRRLSAGLRVLAIYHEYIPLRVLLPRQRRDRGASTSPRSTGIIRRVLPDCRRDRQAHGVGKRGMKVKRLLD